MSFERSGSSPAADYMHDSLVGVIRLHALHLTSDKADSGCTNHLKNLGRIRAKRAVTLLGMIRGTYTYAECEDDVVVLWMYESVGQTGHEKNEVQKVNLNCNCPTGSHELHVPVNHEAHVST